MLKYGRRVPGWACCMAGTRLGWMLQGRRTLRPLAHASARGRLRALQATAAPGAGAVRIGAARDAQGASASCGAWQHGGVGRGCARWRGPLPVLGEVRWGYAPTGKPRPQLHIRGSPQARALGAALSRRRPGRPARRQ